MEYEDRNEGRKAPALNGRFEKASYFLFFLVAFLLPIFNIPFNSLPIEFDKKAFLAVGVLLAFVFWTIARLIDGKFLMPKHGIIRAFWFLLIAMLLASLFSVSRTMSIFGAGFESGTFISLVVFGLAMWLSAYFFQKQKRALSFLSTFLIVVSLVFLYQLINLLTGGWLGFSSGTSTLVGSWNGLGVFLGFTLVLSLSIGNFLRPTGLMKFFTGLVFASSLLAVIAINFSLAWWLVLAGSLLVILKNFWSRGELNAREEDEGESSGKWWKRLAWLSVVASVFFLIFAGFGSRIDNRINSFIPNPTEAKPAWKGTIAVSGDVLAENFFFGVGLNQFSHAWQLYKPDPINQSIFWNTNFNTGVGFVPTFMVTSGFVGILMWIIFILVILFSVLKNLKRKTPEEDDSPSHPILAVSAIATAYLWLAAIIYTTSNTILYLTFIFTGLYIASLIKAGASKNSYLDTTEDKTRAFVAVLVLVIALIVSTTFLYQYFKSVRAFSLFQEAREELANGNILDAQTIFGRVVEVDEKDFYYRGLVDVQLRILSDFVNSTGNNVTPELQNQFIDISGRLHANALRATEINSGNYLNWLKLADVREAFASIGVTGAYEQAKQAYEQARLRSPNHPIIPFRRARLELSLGNVSEGKRLLNEALSLRPSFSDALFIRAQLAVNEGDLDSAIQDSFQAALVNPTNIGVLFQLGLLQYQAGLYEQSAGVLERAVLLNPSYSNAKYFLALSYYEIGRVNDAIKQFEDILLLNPGNENIISILRNLKAGFAPFAGTSANVSEPPISDL